MIAGRVMQWVLLCFLGLLLVVVANHIAGAPSACWVAFAWAFSPVFLAHGTLVTIDLSFAMFYFAFFAAFAFLQRPWRGICAGLALGFCLASKYFARWRFFPALVVCVAWKQWVDKKNVSWSSIGMLMPIAATVVVVVVYRFHQLDLFAQGFGRLLLYPRQLIASLILYVLD